MKHRSSIFSSLVLLGLVPRLPAASAQTGATITSSNGTARSIVTTPDGSQYSVATPGGATRDNAPGGMLREQAIFLGVSVAPAPQATVTKLGLPLDTGLIVTAVLPNSPATAQLRTDDIIVRLNDQLLIDPRQFTVLLRTFKAGDRVKISYYRDGVAAVAEIALEIREITPMTATATILGSLPESMPPEMRARIEAARANAGVRGGGASASGFSTTNVVNGITNSRTGYSDNDGSVEISTVDGKKQAVVKKDGAIVFSGPIDTEEQRAAAGPAVRARIEQVEQKSAAIRAGRGN